MIGIITWKYPFVIVNFHLRTKAVVWEKQKLVFPSDGETGLSSSAVTFAGITRICVREQGLGDHGW